MSQSDDTFEQGLQLVADGARWDAASIEVGMGKTWLRHTFRIYTEPAYLEHRRALDNRGNRKRMEKLQQIIRVERSKPCTDCSKQFPWQIMEFDHVRGKKIRNVGNGTGFNDRTLREEIAKCELRCPTCHTLRHFFEKHPEPQLRLVA